MKWTEGFHEASELISSQNFDKSSQHTTWTIMHLKFLEEGGYIMKLVLETETVIGCNDLRFQVIEAIGL